MIDGKWTVETEDEEYPILQWDSSDELSDGDILTCNDHSVWAVMTRPSFDALVDIVRQHTENAPLETMITNHAWNAVESGKYVEWWDSASNKWIRLTDRIHWYYSLNISALEIVARIAEEPKPSHVLASDLPTMNSTDLPIRIGKLVGSSGPGWTIRKITAGRDLKLLAVAVSWNGITENHAPDTMIPVSWK